MLHSGSTRSKSRSSKASRSGVTAVQPATRQRATHRKTVRSEPRSEVRSKSHTTESRPLVVLLLMVLAAAGLVARLTFWQVMQHSVLSAKAQAQYAGLYVQPARRGLIYDGTGHTLATDVTENQVYAFPREIKQPHRTAAFLAPVLGIPASRLYTLFTSGATSLLLAANVSTGVSTKVTNLSLPGIALGPEIKRYYPEATLASQVLGYVNDSNQGQYGIERYYDGYLSGKAGVRNELRDTAGNSIPIGSTLTPSQDGADLHLTIDGTVQELVEAELQKAVQVHHADSGTIIVMDPRSGSILGMANTPTYDPNHYNKASSLALFRNSAVQDQYEPGSTFKIVTMAAALDTHLITPETSFDDTGSFQVTPTFTVHNWNLSGFGIETMTQVLQHSANVGASFVAHLLGTDRFYRYVRAFRFGKPTGIDVADEADGTLPLPGTSAWTIDNLYTNSYGQGLAVTPIQMITAVAAVANGGIMMKPHVVASMDYRGAVIQHRPVSLGRIISARTAHTLTNMLVHSAVGGEAEQALIKGYNIAAKTGTANIPGTNDHYLVNATVASIVGYAPAFHPRFVALVILRHPRDTLYGSIAAAPVMKNLFSDLFMYYHIPPIGNAINR